MTYSSGYTSLGDSEALVLNIISNNQSRDIMWLIWVNLILNCIIYLMVRILCSISQDVLTLKGYSDISLFLGKPGIDVFKSVQYICQFTSLDFHIILMGFVVSSISFFFSPVENLLQGLTPEKFLKFGIFPSESSSPHRVTETVSIK